MNRLFLLLMMVQGILIGCGGNDNNNNPTTSRIILSADKTAIIANGEEEVVFTVRDEKGNDVTTSCKFKINTTEQQTNIFKTAEAAVYKVNALQGTIESNELEIAAVRENVSLLLKGDKEKLMADGGDLVNLSLLDEQGNNLTAIGEFYADGKKIDGTVFKTTIGGEHKITAVWNGKNVESSLKIVAFPTIPFIDRVLVEDFTATNCQYCYMTIQELVPLYQANNQVVLVSLHVAGAMFVTGTESAKDGIALKSEMGVTGTPSVFLDRMKNKWKPAADGGIGVREITNQIKTLGEVAIAIENKIEGNSVNINATLASAKTFNGKITALLVENGIKASQMNMGDTEMHQMMRDYAPNIMGETINVIAGQLANYKISMPLNGYVQANCRLIVYVTGANGVVENVQQTKLGVNIGY